MVRGCAEDCGGRRSHCADFVMAHHAVADTAYVTNEWHGDYNQAMIEEMKKYPQIIHISGAFTFHHGGQPLD